VDRSPVNPTRVVAGVLVADVVGLLVHGGYVLVFRWVYGNHETLAQVISFTVIPNLLVVPMTMGFVAAYVWRPIRLHAGFCLLLSLGITLTTIGGGYLILKEGIVCLVVASPLLLLSIFAGMMIGREWFSRPATKLQLSVFPLLILAVFADGRLARERTSVVMDSIVIHAPAAAVWPHVIAFPRITTPPHYWLNTVGLPSAAETTCAGEYVGADRACIFSNGLVFKEKVSELEPQRLLTFDVVEQPRDPELLGHLDLRRGQFELQPNADGTTTLIGRSWYTLHVRPLWYFDWWTRDITREVHLRVMRHIKELSEQAR
jgi:hypothetical protein